MKKKKNHISSLNCLNFDVKGHIKQPLVHNSQANFGNVIFEEDSRSYIKTLRNGGVAVL